MPIGGVISNRHFSSLIGSGKECQSKNALGYHREACWGCGVVPYVQGKMAYEKLCPLDSFSMSRDSNSLSAFRIIGLVNGSTPKLLAAFHNVLDHPLSLSLSSSNKLQTIGVGRRDCGICECYLSSGSSLAKWILPQKLEKNGEGQPGTTKVNKTRAGYKSEEYNIAGPNVDSLDGQGEALLLEENVQNLAPWWKQFPKRWVIVLLCFMAFLLCNMDRVNMSIAILPMSQEFKWNSATVGLIQSSFFWGYLLTQIVGGIWADKIGGKLVLGFGVVWWSVATLLMPIAASLGLPFLLVMRAFMGIGEGVAMPAMNNILSKWIPVSERSRSLALVYSGMYLGSVIGLALSPVLSHSFGWPSVFYVFGSLGSVWMLLWLSKAYSSPKEDPDLSLQEKRLILGGSTSKEPVTVIPWKLILSKAPVWALIISHFCHNWGTFILLTWMPTYYNQVLKFNLTESGLFCVLPWLTMAAFANIGGWIADSLVSKGLSITAVRKIMQSIGFLGPAFFLTQLSHVRTPALAVLCMACSQGLDAFSQSGLYSNHQDIGPRYAGVLLGLSNTAGVLGGVFGTAATGYILQRGCCGLVYHWYSSLELLFNG
ncbi:Major facilitator superfamily [Dillenia turbinata]|uniref:Major facilitator superfamily n=1 Tax=Dillenia turbinata TaxID=194707 RepID=A0AAN8UZP0_9MAGN